MEIPQKKTQKKIKKADKKELFQSPKGMHDILPADQGAWERVRNVVQDIADDYSFMRIDSSLVEHADLFARTLGETSDVVEKEMYAVRAKGGEQLVLRPEATASIVRAYLQHGMTHMSQPVRLYYFGPMFRHEQPQSGRMRQFWQVGFEVMGGESDAVYDAQVILVPFRFLEDLKIKNLSVRINSIGCRVCRANYKKKLLEYYKHKEKGLCKDCGRRLKTNSLRLLDCKNSACQDLKAEAPSILDYLCTACSAHFKMVLEYLDELGLSYVLDPRLVRGLDYYSRTVFEIFAEGFDFALAGGGRYDYLVEILGGKTASAVGSAAGIERIVHVMKERGLIPPQKPKQRPYLIHIGELAKRKSLKIFEEFRKAGIPLLESLGKGSLDAQFKNANKHQAPLALIFGQKEAYEESIIIRDMRTGVQETVLLSRAPDLVVKKLKEIKTSPLPPTVFQKAQEASQGGEKSHEVSHLHAAHEKEPAFELGEQEEFPFADERATSDEGQEKKEE